MIDLVKACILSVYSAVKVFGLSFFRDDILLVSGNELIDMGISVRLATDNLQPKLSNLYPDHPGPFRNP